MIIPKKHTIVDTKAAQTKSKCERRGSQHTLLHTRIGKIKALFFDFGSTLYDKDQYAAQAFAAVSKFIAENNHLNYVSVHSLIERLWKIKTSPHQFLLNDLLQILGIYSEKLHQQTLDIYHKIKPVLKLQPGVRELLTTLGQRYKLVLLTDEYPQMEKNKVAALRFNKIFDKIIYVAEHSPPQEKTKLFAYRLALEKMKLAPDQVMFVADNPYEDFKGAKSIGIYTVRIMQGEYKSIRLDDDFEADICIDNTLALRKLLLKYTK